MRSLILLAALILTTPALAEEPLAYSATPVTGVVIDVDGNVVLWLRYKGVVGEYKFELRDTPPRAPDPPDDPAPPETDLTAFVARLTADVEASDHESVADIFRAIADRIASGDLRGSTAIGAATADSLLGAKDKKGNRPNRAAWAPWFSALMTHLFVDVQLVTQTQWEKAYREIAKVVKP
jgi:hypothetical protein